MDELIAQFEKNATEVVRVSLTEYRKRQFIDVRIYYSDDEGQYRPTKKGVSLSPEVYPDFKRALAALEKILLGPSNGTRVTSAGLAANQRVLFAVGPPD